VGSRGGQLMFAMKNDNIINWLLQGDISIKYQVHRDLLSCEKPQIRERIATEGWGAGFLAKIVPNGHWGRSFYQPKWISTHYTLLDLKNLNISPDQPEIKQSLNMILQNEKGPDGGMNPSKFLPDSDVCINGMVLNFGSYFCVDENELKSIVDFVLSQQMPDGGFNCCLNRWGAVHSSLHTTINVVEGILEYKNNSYKYRLDELLKAEVNCRKFILQHKLYKSDKTGDTIDKKFLMLSYPAYWRYDILRALDYFQFAGVKYDRRMNDAIDILLKKRRKDGTWPVQAKHPGQTHFEMEKSGTSSRWNTLRVLRVLRHFRIKINRPNGEEAKRPRGQGRVFRN